MSFRLFEYVGKYRCVYIVLRTLVVRSTISSADDCGIEDSMRRNTRVS